jgi:hypothetical protein
MYYLEMRNADIREKEVDLPIAQEVNRVLQGGAVGGGGQQRQSKTKHERPSLEYGVSEADWRHFADEWAMYKRLSKVHREDGRDEVWCCMTPELKKICVDAGVRGGTVDEEDLIAAVQTLAVRKHNVLISQVQFLNMGQEREETALSYSARLRGKSNLCNFNVLCAGCEVEVSYTDKIMAHQYVRGLVDPVVQAKILAKASGGEELNIKELTTMVEALEMGKRSQALLVGSGGLNRVSDYRQAKDGQ